MKNYVDKDKLQEFATKLNNKQKTIFATKSEVGSPLVASTVAAMTDTNKIYVYVGSESGYTAGNWYYYDGTAWTSGGVYNSTAFETDATLAIPGKAADAKAVGDALAEVQVDTDTTLSQSDVPADAKAAGDAIGEVEADVTDLKTQINYGLWSTDESPFYFQVGVNRAVSSGRINKSNNANRISCPPITPPSRYLKITPKAGTTVGLHGYYNGVWVTPSGWGDVVHNSPAIVDTSPIDAVCIQVITEQTATAEMIPEIEYQVIPIIENDLEHGITTLTSSDFTQGYYSARQIDSSRSSMIATKKMYHVKENDILVFNNHGSNTNSFLVYGYTSETSIWNSGFYPAIEDEKTVVIPATGLLVAQVGDSNGANISPSDYDLSISIINTNYSRDMWAQKKIRSALTDIADNTEQISKIFNKQTKTIAFLGDSITAGSGTNTIYHMYIGSRFGWTCKNYGYGGSGYSRSYTGTSGRMGTGDTGMGVAITNDNKIIPNDFLSRIASVDTNIDALVIFGGTNDWAHGDEISVETFRTAVNNVFAYAQTNFGRIPIIVLLPIHRGNDSTPNSTTEKTLKEYCDIIKECSITYGIKCIDLFAESGLNPANANNNDLYYTRDDTGVSDGLHPNHYAHKAISNLIAETLYNALY